MYHLPARTIDPIGSPLLLLVILFKYKDKLHPQDKVKLTTSPCKRARYVHHVHHVHHVHQHPSPPMIHHPLITHHHAVAAQRFEHVKPEHEVIAQRKEDPELALEPVTEFSMLYRPAYWWYEVYNMCRRLLLTCAVLLCNDLAETTVVGRRPVHFTTPLTTPATYA